MKTLTCPKCKYKWKTKSKLLFVTCPSCQLKVQNKIKKDDVIIWDEAKQQNAKETKS